MASKRKKREQLEAIKGLVAEGAVHYSAKINRFLEEGRFEFEDVEHCVMTATTIHKREVDELNVAVEGWKYTILGDDRDGYPFYTCGKIIADEKGTNFYFFITAHEDELE